MSHYKLRKRICPSEDIALDSPEEKKEKRSKRLKKGKKKKVIDDDFVIDDTEAEEEEVNVKRKGKTRSKRLRPKKRIKRIIVDDIVIDNEDVDNEDVDDFIVDDFIVNDNEDDDEDDENANYWKEDGSILHKCIAHEISIILPSIPVKKLQDSVKKGVANGMKLISDEYVGAQPSDELWKVGLDKNETKKYEKVLKITRANINDEKPTMQAILKAALSTEERKRCIKLFDILQNLEPFSEDELRLSERIGKIIRASKSRDPSLVEQLDDEENTLRTIAINQETIRDRILRLNCQDDIKATIYKRFMDYESMDPSDSNYTTYGEWIDWALSLPYDEVRSPFPHVVIGNDGTVVNAEECDQFISSARKTFDDKMYGMHEVKNRIIEQINNIMVNPKASGIHWALSGPPGVGKTRLGQALSEITGLKYERVSLGGLDDAMFLGGGDKSYVGATPGIIVHILRKVKTRNCIIHLDEVDKLNSKCQYMLLQLLDETTNSSYRDTFLKEIPIDLRGIVFLLSMNDPYAVDKNLADRMMIIRLNGYSPREKKAVIKQFTLKKALQEARFPQEMITVEDDAWNIIFAREPVGNDNKGLRWTEKTIYGIISILNMARTSPSTCCVKGIKFPLTITPDIMRTLVTEYLKGTKDPPPTYVM